MPIFQLRIVKATDADSIDIQQTEASVFWFGLVPTPDSKHQSTKQVLKKKYLQCLVLLSVGKLQCEVPHGASANVYAQLLRTLQGPPKCRLTKRAKKPVIGDDVANLTPVKVKIEKQDAQPITRMKHEKSFMWGKAAFTYVDNSKAGRPDAWQATCLWSTTKHAAPCGKTGCKRRRGFRGDAEEALVLDRLKYWVACYKNADTRIDHQSWEFQDSEIDHSKIMNAPGADSDTD